MDVDVEDQTRADEARAAAEAAARAAPLRVAALLFQLEAEQADVVGDRAAVQAQALAEITKHEMAPLYASTAARFAWPVDDALLARMRAANAAELVAADAKIATAREKFGEVEVFEAQRAKAEALARVGDAAGALAAFGTIAEKGLSTGQRIDVAMAKARIALAAADWAAAKTHIAAAKELNEKGGDWDRRNRLKVYEALVAIISRDFDTAAALLLDSVATFTATELMSYTTFVFYTVITSIKSLERAPLKKRVMDSPDVLSVITELPAERRLLLALHECRYRDFSEALIEVLPAVRRDVYLSRHAAWWLREMRVAAYAQFLKSYRAVTLAGMAGTFGVTPAFLDGELARFIAAGLLHAKIDAIAGVVETTRADAKAEQYQAVITRGDALLNRIQKLSRVMAL